MVILSGDTHAG